MFMTSCNLPKVGAQEFVQTKILVRACMLFIFERPSRNAEIFQMNHEN